MCCRVSCCSYIQIYLHKDSIAVSIVLHVMFAAVRFTRDGHWSSSVLGNMAEAKVKTQMKRQRGRRVFRTVYCRVRSTLAVDIGVRPTSIAAMYLLLWDSKEAHFPSPPKLDCVLLHSTFCSPTHCRLLLLLLLLLLLTIPFGGSASNWRCWSWQPLRNGRSLIPSNHSY